MKRQLLAIACLTFCLGNGQAFARQSPFTDVSTDSWAYQTVAQLAKDGIINGYGDSTFHGTRPITRYEMAQMVAKAMAHADKANAEDKASIEKLSIEFATELQNLGVRVKALEEQSDNMKWTGIVRYTYGHTSYGGSGNDGSRGTAKGKIKTHTTILRFQPIMTVNDHWKIRSRIDATLNMDETASNNQWKVTRLWAEGTFGPNVYGVGRMHTDEYDISGLQFLHRFDKKKLFIVNAGRLDYGLTGTFLPYKTKYKTSGDATMNYSSLTLVGNAGKWEHDFSYIHMQNSNLGKVIGYGKGKSIFGTYTDTSTYHFDKNIAAQLYYAKNPEADDYNKAYAFVLGYKGFAVKKPIKPGYWGAYIAYRYSGQNAQPKAKDTIDTGVRDIDFAIQGTPWAHTFAWFKFARGKTLIGHHDYREYSVRLDYHF